MAVTQNITLDVNQPNIFYYINTKQSDGGRRLRIRITIDGTPYNIPTGATVVFRAAKPDDTFVYESVAVNSDGSCSVNISADTLDVVGKIFADVSVIYGGTIVSSVSFVIMNRDVPMNITALAATTEYSSLNTFVNNTSSYDAALLNKAVGVGLTASLSGEILTIVKNY